MIYSAHELGANENLEGLRDAVAESEGELEVYSQVFRQTQAPYANRKKLGLAVMVGGLLLTGATVVGGLGVALLGAAYAAHSHLRQRLNPMSVASLPSGHHTVTMKGDQTEVARAGRQVKPDAAGYKNFLLENMGKTPGARHVCYFSGHGGEGYTAGLDFDELGTSLREVAQETGQSPELLVFKSCSVGQLENMAALAGSAEAAVASSTPLDSFGFPTRELFAPSKLSGNAYQNAVEMAELLQSREQPIEARAIDLIKLEKETLPALDQLGEQLQRDLLAGHRLTLAKAMADTMVETPFQGEGSLRFDLGKVLANLNRSDLPETTKAALQAVQRTWPSQQSDGLSFHLEPETPAMKEKLPAWTTFVGSLRQELLAGFPQKTAPKSPLGRGF